MEHIQCGPKIPIEKNAICFVGDALLQLIQSRNPKQDFQIDAITDRKISFQTLLDSSLKVALTLKKLQVGRNDVVGMVSENAFEICIPVVASFLLGAVFNPANHSYTENELLHCYAITKPKVIFTSSEHMPKLLNLQKTIKSIKHFIVMDKLMQPTDLNNLTYYDDIISNSIDISILKLQHFDTKETMALYLYSSGTTGLPKAVALSHANLSHTLSYLISPDYFNMKASTVTLGLLPAFHIFGLIVRILPIISECKVIILDKFQPDIFLKAVQDFQINALLLVPPLLLFLAKSPMLDQYNLKSIKIIYCGAAPVGKEIEHLVEQRLNVQVTQLYGLTETSGVVLLKPQVPNKYASVGKVVCNTCIKIVDVNDGKTTLEANAQGEICVKGECVMVGYVNNQKETEATIDADGYLHTGDVGFYDADGYFYIVDRIKELIKYKGFQVAPAELEGLLLKHEGVKEVAVVGKADERAGELTVAFIVRSPKGDDVTAEELIKYVADNISYEKRLHGGVRFVQVIPKNPSGKILRRLVKELLAEES